MAKSGYLSGTNILVEGIFIHFRLEYIILAGSWLPLRKTSREILSVGEKKTGIEAHTGVLTRK